MPLSSCFCHLLLSVLDVLSEPIPGEQSMQPEMIYSSFKVEWLPERLKNTSDPIHTHTDGGGAAMQVTDLPIMTCAEEEPEIKLPD